MVTPTKYDVILQLHFIGKCSIERFTDSFSSHALFKDLDERTLKERLAGLKKNGFLKKEDMQYELSDNDKTKRLLSFLLWCRKDSLDFNSLLKPRIMKAVENIAGKEKFTVDEIGFSRATNFKYFDILENSNFLRVIKKKPKTAVFNLNDKTLHYPFKQETEKAILSCFEKVLEGKIKDLESLKTMKAKGFREKMIQLHIYSTTVTEGNTATKKDVENVVRNLPANLTPKETIEIKNTDDAVELILNNPLKELDLKFIQDVHAIVMRGLIESAGRFKVSPSKRIIGSDLKLPDSKQLMEFSLESMLNFYKRNKNEFSALVLAGIVHFWLVTVHPFLDGNGRTARLIHSKILLEHRLPLFIFDPNKKNEYFSLLEKGRNESIGDFLEFIISEHLESIKGIM